MRIGILTSNPTLTYNINALLTARQCNRLGEGLAYGGLLTWEQTTVFSWWCADLDACIIAKEHTHSLIRRLLREWQPMQLNIPVYYDEGPGSDLALNLEEGANFYFILPKPNEDTTHWKDMALRRNVSYGVIYP